MQPEIPNRVHDTNCERGRARSAGACREGLLNKQIAAELGSTEFRVNSAYRDHGEAGAGSLAELVWIAEKSAILRSTNRFTLRCN